VSLDLLKPPFRSCLFETLPAVDRRDFAVVSLQDFFSAAVEAIDHEIFTAAFANKFWNRWHGPGI
jgi:hypothetical protein